MRKIVILVMLLIFVPITASAMEVYILGVNLKWLKNCEWEKVIAGATASVAVHVLGHLAYLESRGKNWHLEGFIEEHCDDPLTFHQARSFARAGFIAQVGTSLILSSLFKDSDFVKGFCMATLAESASYPYRYDLEEPVGDFAMIRRNGGDWGRDWAVFTGLSALSVRLSGVRSLD